ncbi:DegT/DnrJ/EryC1/StrS family aminotransferase [Terrimonas pollutisoli]|uniref:DegT/DnrJ/EryC1/StrS family aminotransferase n=1 Tax=Terrimonas pollutisoli TaxID=3034147 RepID=UPI0023EBA8E5|nr:DegT/DnrJ/EryC1/StrS family aminotransferase [Terrimonas sp. H1YJ31]
MPTYHNCYVNIDETDIQYLKTAIQKQSISGKGPYVEEFEKALCSYFDSPYALCCSNGTAGIHMVLLLENIQAGDEVMLPPTAPVMCVLPIIAVGAKPVFVDTQSTNFNISIEDLKQKLSAKTKLFINVPMWGYANNIDEVVSVCHQSNVKVLEDNSHCHGTILNDKYLGTFGDYSVFSTHERKLITTGEGAFLLIKNKNDYECLCELRSFGEVSKSDPTFQNIKGNYGHFFGLNFKLSSINAALGIPQLSKLAAKIKARRQNGQYIAEKIAVNDTINELSTYGNSISNYYSIVFITTPDLKSRIEKKLLKNNILSDPLRYKYQPLYQMPLFQKYETHCPNAEILMQSVFTLPVHEGIEMSDLNHFSEIIGEMQYV